VTKHLQVRWNNLHAYLAFAFPLLSSAYPRHHVKQSPYVDIVHDSQLTSSL